MEVLIDNVPIFCITNRFSYQTTCCMKNKCIPLMPGIRYFTFTLLLLFLLSSFVNAQTVSGTISDAGGKPVTGATVTVKGKQTVTTTNDAGRFSINAAGNDVLVITSIGFISKEVAINNSSSLSINLDVDTRVMGEVVVTALGINKEARRLGYSATNVKPEELTINRTPNVMNALQGKVSGVNISSLGTGPGGTSKIRIRGQSAITGGGSPLIVINGVPIDNSNFNNNTVGVTGGGVFADGGDGLSSINPDDIESMTVLKGAPAAALYGNRASNGVIMITTKTKGKTRGIGITVNTNYTNETPLDFTDYQKEYGQGENGVRPLTANPTSGQWSFGERIQDRKSVV